MNDICADLTALLPRMPTPETLHDLEALIARLECPPVSGPIDPPVVAPMSGGGGSGGDPTPPPKKP